MLTQHLVHMIEAALPELLNARLNDVVNRLAEVERGFPLRQEPLVNHLVSERGHLITEELRYISELTHVQKNVGTHLPLGLIGDHLPCMLDRLSRGVALASDDADGELE